jgi:diacylglycerol kinase family enzyme
VPGIGLITNPRSRVNRRDPSRIRRLGYLIGAHGQAKATRSLDDLHRVCEDFHKERIDLLGISGGDGTMHHTLTAMIRAYGDDPLPPVAILRGGTMNTVATSLGIRGETPRLLFELIDKHSRGLPFDTFTRRLLRVGDAYGFIFGNGLIYNFLELYYESGNPSPPVAARIVAMGSASAMIGGALARRLYRRVHARVTVDGEVWAREDFGVIAAAVVEQIGLGFKPFYRLHDKPDHFQILGIHTDVFGFVSELPRIFAGQPMRRDKVIDSLAQHVLMESDEEIGYTVDGDNYVVKGRLEMGLGPRVTLIRLSGDARSEEPMPKEVPEPPGSGVAPETGSGSATVIS